MSRLALPRLLATGAVVTASTAVRVGSRCAGLWTRRTPALVRLAADVLTAPNQNRSEAALRDELLGLLRDSAEVSWLELRRGVDDFDAFTRPDEQPTMRDGGTVAEPMRRYRAKP